MTTTTNQLSSAVPPSPDNGPWAVNTWSGQRVVLQSDDFEFDVALEVTGDFGSVERKKQYAEELATWMNHHLGVSPGERARLFSCPQEKATSGEVAQS